jgi:hypothetical protein
MVKCLVCNAEFADDKSLHRHVKAHGFHVFEYYQHVTPRRDLHDGSLILFKNKEQYFKTDFNSITNMRLWLDAQTPEKRAEYMKALLSKRQTEKHLEFAPTQVELRSLKMPGMFYYNQVFVDYYALTDSMGFRSRYEFVEKLDCHDLFRDAGAKIFIDTREQLPLEFDCPTETVTLKFGDYSFSKPDPSGAVHVERKSIGDFIGTLSGGRERFEREIVRAKEAGAYLVVLVEENLANAIKFNTLESVYHKNTKATPEFVFHNVRELIQRYEHIQFLFVKDRKQASSMVKRLFCCGNQIRKIDLQYHYDIGLL